MRILAFDTCFGAVSVAVRTQTDHGETVLRLHTLHLVQHRRMIGLVELLHAP